MRSDEISADQIRSDQKVRQPEDHLQQTDIRAWADPYSAG